MEVYRLDARTKKSNVEDLLDCRDCLICEQPTELFCYHHIKEKEKEMSIVFNYSYGVIVYEIVKCIPVCNTCHVRLHASKDYLYHNVCSEDLHKYTKEYAENIHDIFWCDKLYPFLEGIIFDLTDSMSQFGPKKIKNVLKKIPGDLVKKLKTCNEDQIAWFTDKLEMDPIKFIKTNASDSCIFDMVKKGIITSQEYIDMQK